MLRWFVVIHKILACIRHTFQSNWPNGRVHCSVWHYFVDKPCYGMCDVETAQDFSFSQLMLFDRHENSIACNRLTLQRSTNKLNWLNWNYIFDKEMVYLKIKNYIKFTYRFSHWFGFFHAHLTCIEIGWHYLFGIFLNRTTKMQNE